MIAKISSLLLLSLKTSIAPLMCMMASLPSERMHLSIPNFTDRVWKNSYCALGMTISDHDIFLMDESSICWVVLSDISNAFYD